jgi:hypothetical protein
MPCVGPRWKAGWNSWECCGPSPDQGLATTTPTPNRFSEPQSTGLTTRGDHSPACRRHASGWRHLWIGTIHRHRHSGIKFVTPHQRHSGQVVDLCRHRAHVYEQARQRKPRRWSRSARCWRQPEVVCINPPQPEIDLRPATFAMAA